MPARDLKLLHDAALAAGEIAKKFFKADPEIWDKGNNQGPVTEADLAIDRMLKHELLGARPDYGWLSEESEDSSDRLKHDRVFIIDPIDGTRAFIAGENSFSHSLAIAENGKVIAALVHLPIREQTYAAHIGGGATCNGNPIQPSETRNSSGANILTTKPSLNPDLWPGGVPDLNRHFRPSLAYRLCLAADGRFDGMITLRDAWEWDIAAGDLIVTEAGGIASDRLGAKPVYNNPHPMLAGMIAAPKPVHADIMLRLKPAPKTAS
ncbi:MAG: 3'(2'),5'-bisphosphate nucleotidase CysQ [Rhodobacteraceae bacterium]|nr:3'(2'),5'-bisphosphate nucleotidase CysQ [Paracoccaceae bacterium]